MDDKSNTDIIWGIRAIATEAGIFDENGEPNERVTQDRLRRGVVPGWKRGRRWQSARSVIRRVLTSA